MYGNKIFYDLTKEPPADPPPAVVINEAANVEVYDVPGATIIEVRHV